MSKALEMRARALMVALVSGFDLTGRMDWLASIRQDYERDRQPSRRSLVVGAGVPGLADWIAQDIVSTGGEITIVDEPATTVAVAPRPGLRVVKTKLDDYAFDPRAFDQALGSVAMPTFETVHGLLRTLQETARSTPLIAEATCDQVIQVWLGNRLTATAHQAALTDTLRVARKGGRLFAVVLLADEPIDVTTGAVPAVLKDHLVRLPTEQDYLAELAAAGWHGITLTPLSDSAVFGRDKVEVRAFSVRAYKGKQGPCYEQGHAVIYRGPYQVVHDDYGHAYPRGERVAVCQKTHDLLMQAPYTGQFISLPCYRAPALADAALFDCATPTKRAPAVTKGFESLPTAAASCCGPSGSSGGSCCG